MTVRDKARRLLAAAIVSIGAVGPLAVAAPAAHADAARTAQWPIGFLNLPQAWKTTKGAGITVAVLDTGVVATRPDLTGQVTTGPDLVKDGGVPGDPDWGVHGTGMASIIAGHGHGPNNGDGIMGVAPAAKILSIRVIRDDDSPDRGLRAGSAKPISEGITYAVDHGAQVISMSLGGSVPGAESDTTAEAAAVRYAIAHGVSIVVSAGNDGEHPEQDVTMYPAGERGVIGVAAVDNAGKRAYFSSTGWDVAVAAPGVDIPMTLPIDDPTGTTYSGFGPVIGASTLVGDGTSPACAYVAGVVALLRSANPKLSPVQIAQVLKSTTSRRPAGGRDDKVGTGIVDPVAALKAAATLAPEPATPTAAVYNGPEHFGYGPVVVANQRHGALSKRKRGALNAGLALLTTGLAAGWLLLRGRRKAQLALTGGPAGMGMTPFAAPVTPSPMAYAPGAGPAGAMPMPIPIQAPLPVPVPVPVPEPTPEPTPAADQPTPATVDTMNDFAGRTIAPSAFPSDDGAADPALIAVLEAHGRGHAEVERAYGYLLNARVFAPIVAVLGEAEEVQDDQGRNLRRDKNSDMALVTLVAPDGTRALPVFTSVAALTAWNPEARPMPVAFPRACAAAKAEAAEIVLVDLGQASFLEVEPAAVRAFAGVLEKAEQQGSETETAIEIETETPAS